MSYVNVVFLDCTNGFGRKFTAANYKIKMIARGLAQLGDSCLLHNGIKGDNTITAKSEKDVPEIGKELAYPKKGISLFDFLLNVGSVYGDLKKYKSPDGFNVIILLSPFYHVYLEYLILAKKLGYKIVTISHEWLPTIREFGFARKVNAYIYSRLFGYGVDGILPISEYIIQKAQRFQKPMLKTPVLSDFNDKDQSSIEKKGFAYCASLNYYRVIKLLLKAYLEYAETTVAPQSLTLIVSGSDSQIKQFRNTISNILSKGEIKVVHKLSDEELHTLYRNSSALILPLDPNSEQDKARFSQKIAEYLSSRSPIITTNVGEIQHYFTNCENAIITDYSVKGFVNAFKWVHDNAMEAREIGEKGFELGTREFDAAVFAKKLHNFLLDICSQNKQ